MKKFITAKLKSRKNITCLCIILLSLCSIMTFAQQGINITGTVTDNGDPLPGVSVRVKDTTIGMSTDVNGNYSLTVPSNDAVLVFSFIGYVTRELTVGNQRIINLELIEDTKQIDEVVVIGYGTQKKVNLTGAVSTVTGNELVKRPVTNPTTMLQGQVPGLSVVQGT